jgi:hypothetical protein
MGQSLQPPHQLVGAELPLLEQELGEVRRGDYRGGLQEPVVISQKGD